MHTAHQCDHYRRSLHAPKNLFDKLDKLQIRSIRKPRYCPPLFVDKSQLQLHPCNCKSQLQHFDNYRPCLHAPINLCDKLDKLDSDRYKRAPLLEHCTLNVHFACLSTTLIASSLTAWLKKGTSAIAQVEQLEQEIAQLCAQCQFPLTWLSLQHLRAMRDQM